MSPKAQPTPGWRLADSVVCPEITAMQNREASVEAAERRLAPLTFRNQYKILL